MNKAIFIRKITTFSTLIGLCITSMTINARRFGFGPLFSFGQHILEPKTTVISNGLWYFRAQHRNFSVATPSILYTPNKVFVAIAELPLIVQSNSFGRRTRGIGDFRTQFEFIPYLKETKRFQEYITLVTTLRFPTSTTDFTPTFATKTANVFVGASGIVQDDDWYLATSIGATAYPADPRPFLRNQLVYEFVFGRSFLTKPRDSLNILLELNGIYQLPKDILLADNKFSRREGRTIVYFGPLFRWLRGRSLLQIGFQLPLALSNQTEAGYLDYRGAIMLSVGF